MNYFSYQYEDWTFTIYEEDEYIISIDDTYTKGGKESDLIRLCYDEIVNYLSGSICDFTVPFKLVGSDFQVAVWEEVCRIPYGETRTYRRIAELIGRPRAYRAVGTACANCQFLFLVPCQRVVSSSGKNELSSHRLRLRTLEMSVL